MYFPGNLHKQYTTNYVTPTSPPGPFTTSSNRSHPSDNPRDSKRWSEKNDFSPSIVHRLTTKPSSFAWAKPTAHPQPTADLPRESSFPSASANSHYPTEPLATTSTFELDFDSRFSKIQLDLQIQRDAFDSLRNQVQAQDTELKSTTRKLQLLSNTVESIFNTNSAHAALTTALEMKLKEVNNIVTTHHRVILDLTSQLNSLKSNSSTKARKSNSRSSSRKRERESNVAPSTELSLCPSTLIADESITSFINTLHQSSHDSSSTDVMLDEDQSPGDDHSFQSENEDN